MASALTHGEAFAGIPIFIGTASSDQKSGVQVLQMLVKLGVDLHGGAGRHSSQQEWRRTVGRRAGSQPLFRDTLSAKLHEQVLAVDTYMAVHFRLLKKLLVVKISQSETICCSSPSLQQ